jgi:hypothetical protein
MHFTEISASNAYSPVADVSVVVQLVAEVAQDTQDHWMLQRQQTVVAVLPVTSSTSSYKLKICDF